MATKKAHAPLSQCPIACALDIFGDHWTLIIMRDLLMFNRHEFHQFLDSSEGISTNILSDRLTKLQANGLIACITHPENRKRKLYYPTKAGEEVLHLLLEIGRWSNRWLADKVRIPAHILGPLERDPQEFKRRLLENSANWKKKYGLI
jgi:DNA-binding HxlR family transcriptional regulator